MTEQTARELLMEYLYEEISAADKTKLETYLADHPDMRQELEELQTTRSLLQQAPEVEPDEKLSIIDPGKRSFGEWWRQAGELLPRSGWGKAALGAAACLIFLLVAVSAANISIRSAKNGLSIHFGYGHPSQPKQALTTEQTKKIINKLQQDNTAILAQYAEMLNKQNQQQLQQVAQHFERQRQNDLQVISKALNQYQQTTEVRFKKTHQVMGQMLQTVAATAKYQQ